MSLSPQAQKLLLDRQVQIGNICFQWAHLEYLLAITIHALLGIDNKTGNIVTGGLDILPRTGMALALCSHLNAPPPLAKAIKIVRSDLQDGKKLQERRNRAIHGHRRFDPSDPSAEFVTITRGKGAGTTRQTNLDLETLGKDIAATHKAFYQALSQTGVLNTPLQPPARIIARNAPRSTGPNESTAGS